MSTHSHAITIPRLVITAGEPAGIGPDIVIKAAQQDWPAELICIADKALLESRARALKLPLRLIPANTSGTPAPTEAGTLRYIHVPLSTHAIPGTLDTENASYVLATLNVAATLCETGEAGAMITAPVQKSVINDAGIPFSGHTEFLAELTDTEQVVMLLAAGDLRVALATTHIPLRDVADAITAMGLERTLTILHTDLIDKWGIESPRITVLGLNPHAGEGGHLGHEEQAVIEPVIAKLQAQGMRLSGPLPADTAFSQLQRQKTDAYLAMYHDQGLPVLKYAGFGEAVNITLGLPILRTSVDHGTALDLAGTGEAHASSLIAAIQQAIHCISRTTH